MKNDIDLNIYYNGKYYNTIKNRDELKNIYNSNLQNKQKLTIALALSLLKMDKTKGDEE